MELTQTRKIKTGTTTVGDFGIDGSFFSYGLEPTDRGLTDTMTVADILAKKIDGATAVPTGRYRVVKFLSPDHGIWLPRVIGIPGFGYIEIHVGNFAKDTKGCLLLGSEIGPDEVLHSGDIIKEFYEKFFAAIDNHEEVWITYQDAA
jgi:hypothetical protein